MVSLSIVACHRFAIRGNYATQKNDEKNGAEKKEMKFAKHSRDTGEHKK